MTPASTTGFSTYSKKDGNYLHLSDVIGYFKTFLNENPSEALIMLASRGNDEATDESITTAFAKVMADNPNLFYSRATSPRWARCAERSSCCVDLGSPATA